MAAIPSWLNYNQMGMQTPSPPINYGGGIRAMLGPGGSYTPMQNAAGPGGWELQGATMQRPNPTQGNYTFNGVGLRSGQPMYGGSQMPASYGGGRMPNPTLGNYTFNGVGIRNSGYSPQRPPGTNQDFGHSPYASPMAKGSGQPPQTQIRPVQQQTGSYQPFTNAMGQPFSQSGLTNSMIGGSNFTPGTSSYGPSGLGASQGFGTFGINGNNQFGLGQQGWTGGGMQMLQAPSLQNGQTATMGSGGWNVSGADSMAGNPYIGNSALGQQMGWGKSGQSWVS